MATHVNSTRTPLLRQTTGSIGLLPAGLPVGRIVAAGGPVTRALAVMATADPELARIRALRRSIADRIEADIALLDALHGDPDFELGADAEPSLCGVGTHDGGSLSLMASTYEGDDREHDAGDEGEDENEHGGDIQDERHDLEPDGEPSLGSLGGTAEGCEGSQASWSAGDSRDREVSPDSPVHNKLLSREPGPALIETRAELARYRYARNQGHANVTLIGGGRALLRIGA